jgi:outer membrane protein TolC
MRTAIGSKGVAMAFALAAALAATTVYGQTPPPAATVSPPPAADDTTPVPIPDELSRTTPGGVTSEQAGIRAARTSWSAKAATEQLRGAAARVDEAWAAFLPKLSGLAKYTRLSDFTPPAISFFPPGINLVTSNAPGDVTRFDQLHSVPIGGSTAFSFFVLDNWLLSATISIPISDYFLRLDQGYTAATRSQDAARWDVVTARTTSGSNGRLAYYTWLNARAAVVVAIQALNDQKTHLRDARNQFVVGNASRADVLRAETAVSAAELTMERAKNLADLSEKQLRVAVHAAEDERLVPGEDLDAPSPPVQGNLKQMTAEALSSRPEVKSADANADSTRALANAAKAARWPVLSAFGDAIEGNPNPRVIPPSNVWFGTWDVGAQLTWALNDVLIANGNVADTESRAAEIVANRNVTRDNIEIEVTQMLQAVREADFSIGSSTRELASAAEAYRVASELFNNGRGTSTTLADAESDLTRARLDLLNAKVAAKTARVRLDHATGRDAQLLGSGAQ